MATFAIIYRLFEDPPPHQTRLSVDVYPKQVAIWSIDYNNIHTFITRQGSQEIFIVEQNTIDYINKLV